MKPIIYCSIFLLLACGEKKVEPVAATGVATQTQEQPISASELIQPVGEIHASIPVRKDSSQTYALYLPKTYSPAKGLPVIIFFDPQGDGALPVKLYKDLADTFGVILAGSNTSKNGLTAEEALNVADNLIEEVTKGYAVNKSKITLAGHSGGAKAALQCAAFNSAVSSVIYSGAAMQVKSKNIFTLIGFAGLHDMNYADLVTFEWTIPPSIPHYFFEWDGKHEFPRAQVFKKAFELLYLGQVPVNPTRSVSATAIGINQEQELKQKYIRAFNTESLSWWQKEIKDLNKTKDEKIMNERLLGFISLACYTFIDSYLKQGNVAAGKKLLSIYKMADPQNKAIADFEKRMAAQSKR